MNTEDRIDTLIPESVGDPPHQIGVAQVRRRALRTRLRAVALLAALTVALLGSSAAITFGAGHRTAVAGLGQVCTLYGPADVRRQLPADFRVATVIWCSSQLVHRPGQGWWLQIVERHAVKGAYAYGEALKLPPPPKSCLNSLNRNQPAAVFLADRSRHVVPVVVPFGCEMPNEQVIRAQRGLTWQPAKVRWIRQILTDAQTASRCFYDWRANFTFSSFMGFQRTSSQSMQGADFYPGGYVCIVRMFGATGPTPDDLIEARRTVQPAVVTALSATAGVSGPVPLTSHKTCRSATKTAYELLVAGRLIGYADLGKCMRVVGPDLGPASADTRDVLLHLIAFG